MLRGSSWGEIESADDHPDVRDAGRQPANAPPTGDGLILAGSAPHIYNVCMYMYIYMCICVCMYKKSFVCTC